MLWDLRLRKGYQKMGKINKLLRDSFFCIDVFGYGIYIVFNIEDFNKIDKYFLGNKHIPLDLKNGATRSYYLENGQRSIIGIFDNKIQTIVHESTHIALFILFHIKHTIIEFDEILPYLTDTIFNEVYNRWITKDKQ